MRAPLDTVKDTPLKISVGPYDLESELTVMRDMIFQVLVLNAPYYKAPAPGLSKKGQPLFILKGI